MAPRPTPRMLTLAAAAAGAGTGVALQRRHAQRIAADPDFRSLNAPLDGQTLAVTSADGTRLYAEAFGPAGADTVVLAHGWTEELRFWNAVIQALLQKDLRVVAYDLRGHGRSQPAADADYSLERFGDDVEAVLAAAGPDGPVAVVAGHSLGAMSIAAWAESHEVRSRTRAAALINTGLGDLLGGHLLLGELAQRFSSPMVAKLVLGSKTRLPGFSSPWQHAVIRHAAFGPNATPGQVAFYERMLMSTSPAARAAAGVALSDMDLWDAVAHLTVPTLVIAGERDRLTPPAHARRIAETLPQLAGLIELAETGHMAPLEEPRRVARALSGLVADTKPVTAAA